MTLTLKKHVIIMQTDDIAGCKERLYLKVSFLSSYCTESDVLLCFLSPAIYTLLLAPCICDTALDCYFNLTYIN